MHFRIVDCVSVNPDLLDQGFTVFADLDEVEQSRTWAERENGCAIVCRPESSSVRDFIAAIAGPELAQVSICVLAASRSRPIRRANHLQRRRELV